MQVDVSKGTPAEGAKVAMMALKMSVIWSWTAEVSVQLMS